MESHPFLKTRRRNQGFTRRELLVIIILILLLAGVWLSSHGTIPRGSRANAAAKTGKAIHTWLQAYAIEHNGKFPEAPDFSNTAFRQLFVKQYLDDEQGFAITGDAWLKHAPGGNQKPDNDIGEEPDFAQALMPGECSWAYVTGLTVHSDPTLPLLGNAFSETIGVYARNRNTKGGVFGGEKGVWVTVGGSARVQPLSRDLTITGEKNGKTVNVYSKDWGTVPENVRNPAGG
ncbi:MAG: hypothetical protein EOP86_27240 [Verrucomicrobiaceae bacterium]|nr:MAG: hypothetical protein EOP86_27240 [Verrucomicrobiaceae bacterium]